MPPSAAVISPPPPKERAPGSVNGASFPQELEGRYRVVKERCLAAERQREALERQVREVEPFEREVRAAFDAACRERDEARAEAASLR